MLTEGLKQAIDDPTKLNRVVGSAGKSGASRELAYTNCKVVGNGSFGVVFSAKLVYLRESVEPSAPLPRPREGELGEGAPATVRASAELSLSHQGPPCLRSCGRHPAVDR